MISPATPDISVITPSFNSLSYLKRCCASVRDQTGVSLEHIVMDGASTDGTPEWLATQPHLVWKSEKDKGMYDAINKGLKLARGRYVAYLNCDEQYLPGTLELVARTFEHEKKTDIVFGDGLLVRPDGSFLAYRKSYPLRIPYVLTSHLYALTACIFWRRRLIEDGIFFDTSFRDLGDNEFIVRCLQRGYRARHVGKYFAVFTMTGQNMSSGENARREIVRRRNETPVWMRMLKWPLTAIRLTEKALRGAYFQRWPLEYSIYTGAPGEHRTKIRVGRGSFRWRTG